MTESNRSLKEILANLLQEHGEAARCFFNDETDTDYSWSEPDIKSFAADCDNLGISYELVDSYGGEEQGREFWSVYSFTRGAEKETIKFDGWYASYDGSNYEEWYFVKSVPVQKFEFIRA